MEGASAVISDSSGKNLLSVRHHRGDRSTGEQRKGASPLPSQIVQPREEVPTPTSDAAASTDAHLNELIRFLDHTQDECYTFFGSRMNANTNTNSTTAVRRGNSTLAEIQASQNTSAWASTTTSMDSVHSEEDSLPKKRRNVREK